MQKIAIYGKGGIGKSTITSHLSAALAAQGKRIIQIGCDPKADSTSNLLGGQPLPTVMDYLRAHDDPPRDLASITREGFGGVLCIETGGPTPGLGCAGRGIIATFRILEDLRLFSTFQPDIVLYDVLGDVVCGGFAAPIREGYAQDVLIVTSGEKMALYAAGNIASAVENFKDRGYAKTRGLILNRRNIPNETEKVQPPQSRRNQPGRRNRKNHPRSLPRRRHQPEIPRPRNDPIEITPPGARTNANTPFPSRTRGRNAMQTVSPYKGHPPPLTRPSPLGEGGSRIFSPTRTGSEATASAPPGRPAPLRVRQARLREGGDFATASEAVNIRAAPKKPTTPP